MSPPRYPALLEINTRHWLFEIARELGRPATLDDLDEIRLANIVRQGFDWVWLLGIWQTGEAGRAVSASVPEWQVGFHQALDDFTAADVVGSPFAVQRYEVHADFGGNAALARLRQRLRSLDLRLMLDFVPNHTALDHQWVTEHPEYYIAGTEQDLAAQPQNFCRVAGRILAHGRDPNFSGWPDTLQLDYRSPAVRQAMIAELRKVAKLCDGVRCDMAMLLLADVFQRTWGAAEPTVVSSAVSATISAAGDTSLAANPFWPAAIAQVRQQSPGFLFLAEAYWGLEWTLQQQGFDFTYDKTLYDRLLSSEATAVHDHLRATPEYQNHSARFLENHDEPRIAARLPMDRHRAAALIAYLVPGLRFFHDGQLQGRRTAGSIHLRRRAVEPANPEMTAIYKDVLTLIRRDEVRNGLWTLLDCRSAWEGNPTHQELIAFRWSEPESPGLVIVVNFSPVQAQGYVEHPLPELSDQSQILLVDQCDGRSYGRNGPELNATGLYVDLPPWGAHVLEPRL